MRMEVAIGEMSEGWDWTGPYYWHRMIWMCQFLVVRRLVGDEMVDEIVSCIVFVCHRGVVA